MRSVTLLVLISQARAQTTYSVGCKEVQIPTLTENLPNKGAKTARICAPQGDAKFPLHILAHGDGGGGSNFISQYGGLQQQLASFGLVVAGYQSCFSSVECTLSEGSFLEVLKTVEFLAQNPQQAPVDQSKAWSVTGHSTGGRVVMMLAALRDNPQYLQKTKFASQITESMRASLRNLKAVIADHPDAIYLPTQFPDIPNFKVTETPTFVITGSKDTTEPTGSAWKDFQMLNTPDKVFLNMRGAQHNEPNRQHQEGPFIAAFVGYFALGDTSDGAYIYGDGPQSLQKVLPIAGPGGANSGEGAVAFLACSRNASAIVPPQYAKYC